MKRFKDCHSHEDRSNESKKIMIRYPERIPIIVEKAKGCRLANLSKNKYLAPKDMTMSQFVFMVRKRIQLEPSEAMFLMVNHSLVNGSALIGQIYTDHKESDGFLYMIYTSENTFG
tara:strand:+ start:1230 stop:1577 length:348 start_codon:yes stop_codon:yes gene_type:complete